jgi:DNA polymerase III epsilon subunit-like protein
MSKILVWDLETTALQADRGHILTAACTWVDSDEVWTWSIDDGDGYGSTPVSFMDDSWIVEGLVACINEADMLVHHYGDRFDLPFLNTRALFWGYNPPNPVRTIDTWKVARTNLAMRSNRLAALCELLNSEDGQKGGLSLDVWQLAGHGDKETIAKILEYNVKDVEATLELYLNLRPIIKNHPNLAVPNGNERSQQCPACGSSKTASQGSYYTKNQHVLRRRCRDCGVPFEEGRRTIKVGEQE